MKRVLFLPVSLMLFSLAISASAQEIVSANAGLLQSIWYSNNRVAEGEEIKIFGGFQNHSTNAISGQAVFLVDGENVFSKDFISKPETLTELEGIWKATGGGHKIQIKLENVDTTILSSISEEAELNVKRVITKEKVVEFAQETGENIVEKIDDVTQTLSNKILELKKPDLVERSDLENSGLRSALGEDKKNTPLDKGETEGVSTRSAYNLALSFLSASVLRWKWTLGAIILLLLVAKFTSR